MFVCSMAEMQYEDPDDPKNQPADPKAKKKSEPPPILPLEPQPYPTVTLRHEGSHEAKVPLPSSWVHRDASDVTRHLVDVTRTEPHLVSAIEKGLQLTAHNRGCVGRDGTGQTRRAKVLSVHRVEHKALWKQYWHRRSELLEKHEAYDIKVKPLDPPAMRHSAHTWWDHLDVDGLLDQQKLNEAFLFHGTDPDVALVHITEHGFDERVANLNGLYGAGSYFANQSCKASQYAKATSEYVRYEGGVRWLTVKTMIIARVALGDPYYATGHRQKARRPPVREQAPQSIWQFLTQGGMSKPGADSLTYDSVVANESGTQIHREFILYGHEAAAYPEYVVKYIEA